MRGTGIDTLHLQNIFFQLLVSKKLLNFLDQKSDFGCWSISLLNYLIVLLIKREKIIIFLLNESRKNYKMFCWSKAEFFLIAKGSIIFFMKICSSNAEKVIKFLPKKPKRSNDLGCCSERRRTKKISVPF